ncbi:Pro-rich N-terminal domain-containing protein [Streptomyces sp. NBC_00075]|uniref:Pro-rich N-terminal domain-containing protein n=1 Tax=Streptomyces sp. NBC_00093 TaxID=2975649 RepID=A0AAU2ABU9_9ACTN
MQHAVGSPLPPPHQPGQGPDADWSSAAPHAGQQPPGAHPGSAPPNRPPAPAPVYTGGAPSGPGSVYTGGAPSGPGPQAPHPPVPQHAPVPQHVPVPPPPDTTGHVPLPQGDFVPTPGSPPATGALDPASAPLAVLLIGPAGAGKTSVAKYWADHRRVPTAHISLDDVREWVRSGFADPQSGWNDHSEAQYRLARRTCGFAARNFLANGISCILDDAVFPDRPVVGLGGWKRHVGPGLLPVVLLPGLEIVLERNAERSGNRRLTDEEVARIHGRMAGWYGSGLPIIDNSQLDVPATARVLDDVLARLVASPPKW